MEHSVFRNLLFACQLGYKGPIYGFLFVVSWTGGPSWGSLSRLEKWVVGTFYFAGMCYYSWDVYVDHGLSPVVAGALMGFLSCALIDGSVAAVTWLARILERIRAAARLRTLSRSHVANESF